MGFMTISVFA